MTRNGKYSRMHLKAEVRTGCTGCTGDPPVLSTPPGVGLRVDNTGGLTIRGGMTNARYIGYNLSKLGLTREYIQYCTPLSTKGLSYYKMDLTHFQEM
eukprot:1183476-Prorocentrum_minimum.AAC.1